MKGPPFFYDSRWDEKGKEWENKTPREQEEWRIWNTIIWLVIIGGAILMSYICF